MSKLTVQNMEKKDKCKERSNNFSSEEMKKLKELLEKYNVIFNKKTDHASAKQKDEAWSQLSDEFNANNSVYRTKKQLIYKFNNMKKFARKELAQEKRERRATGGGPPPPKPSDTSDWICSIMSESIVGLPSTYDSDLVQNYTDNTEDTVNNVAVPKIPDMEIPFDNIMEFEDQTNEIVCVDDTTTINTITDFQGQNTKFDTTTPKSMLKQPVSKPLVSDNRKRKLLFTPLETRKKIVTMVNEKENFMKKKGLREGKLLEFAEEEHLKNMIHKEELHKIEVEFKKKLHDLVLRKAAVELEIEEEKLKNMKAANNNL